MLCGSTTLCCSRKPSSVVPSSRLRVHFFGRSFTNIEPYTWLQSTVVLKSSSIPPSTDPCHTSCNRSVIGGTLYCSSEGTETPRSMLNRVVSGENMKEEVWSRCGKILL